MSRFELKVGLDSRIFKALTSVVGDVHFYYCRDKFLRTALRLDHHVVYRLMLVFKQPSEADRPALLDAVGRSRKTFRTVIKHDDADRLFARDDPGAVAYGCHGRMYGLVVLHFADELSLISSFGRLRRAILDVTDQIFANSQQ